MGRALLGFGVSFLSNTYPSILVRYILLGIVSIMQVKFSLFCVSILLSTFSTKLHANTTSDDSGKKVLLLSARHVQSDNPGVQAVIGVNSMHYLRNPFRSIGVRYRINDDEWQDAQATSGLDDKARRDGIEVFIASFEVPRRDDLRVQVQAYFDVEYPDRSVNRILDGRIKVYGSTQPTQTTTKDLPRIKRPKNSKVALLEWWAAQPQVSTKGTVVLSASNNWKYEGSCDTLLEF